MAKHIKIVDRTGDKYAIVAFYFQNLIEQGKYAIRCQAYQDEE